MTNIKSPFTREELTSILNNEILNTKQVMEILGVSRQRLFQLIAEGKLKPPIRKLERDNLFWKVDIDERLRELEKTKKYTPKSMRK